MGAVLNAALPIFALIGIGFVAGRRGFLDGSATDSLNRFAIYLALPALLFSIVSRVAPREFAELGFVAAYTGGAAVPFVLAYLWARARRQRSGVAAIDGMNASYPNAGFMGLPLCLLVFGPDAQPAIVVTMVLTACALFLIGLVIVEADSRRGASAWSTARRVGRSLVLNPLLLAPLAGIAVAGLGGPPPALDRCAALLGAAASPVALVCIGLFLGQERFAGDVRVVAALVGLKLVVQPLATALLALYLLPVPPLWAKVAILSSALPVGTGPFTLAKAYGLDPQVTSGAILASHAASVVTVTALVAWLG
ncbi:MAG: AEC family transporter [Methylobacteriaceae bacterium]|nr:AEC family transporter [Methylobacteriaceae bacterium]